MSNNISGIELQIKGETSFDKSFDQRLKYRESPKQFMPIPKKLICMCILLSIIGISFLISGLVDYFHGERSRGIGFLVFGCLTFIPACRAGTPEERAEILSDVPMDL